MADPVIDYSLMQPIMQPIQSFGIDWNALGNQINTGIGNLGPTPSTVSTANIGYTTPTGYTYPTLSSLSNEGIDAYRQVKDYYATHPQQYVPMMQGLNQFVTGKVMDTLYESLPYQEDPRYAEATSVLNNITGGDPNFYQSVSDLGTMAQLNDAYRDMADARADYTWAVTTGGIAEPSAEKYMPTYFNDVGNIPVGKVGDTTIYAFGATPGEGNYYINKEGTGVEYFEPDKMGGLETAFVTGIGALMGGIAGGPFGAAALGGGLGAGAGSLMTDSMNEQPLDWTKAGVTALATYGGGAIAPAVTTAVTPALTGALGNTAGTVAGGAVGGAAGGAVRGGLTGAYTAAETGEWDPVLYGAGIGGVVGGITGGIGAYNSLDNLSASDKFYVDRYLQQNPSPYYDTITGEMIYPASLSTDELLAQAYQAANPGFTPFTVDPLLQYATPADTALQGTLENSNALGTTNPEELADKFYTDRYTQQNPSPYYDTITQQMIYPPGITPDEALVQDYTKANPTPTVAELASPPSIMGDIGKAVLDNKKLLDYLAKLLGGAGAATGAGAFPDGGGRPGMASPDAVTEFLMQHGGTGKGKSKGLGAGEVKGPYYGDSFMPGLKEIDKYNEQGLYYT